MPPAASTAANSRQPTPRSSLREASLRPPAANYACWGVSAMFAISSLRSLTGAFLIGALLAGCGGGGASTAGSVPAGPGLGASSALKIHLDVPLTKSGAANRRKPQYVSASTQSFAVTVGANPPVNVNVSSISPACTLNTAITETNTNSTQPNQLTKVADGTVWYGLQSGQAIKQILAGGAPGNNVSTYDASNPMYYDSITSIGPDVDGSLWTGHFDTGVYTVGHVTGGNSYTPVSMGNFGSYFATSFASGAAAGDEYFTYEDSTPTLQPHLGHIAAGAVDALPHGSLSGNAIRVKAGSGRVWFNEDNGSVGYMLTDGTYTTHEFTPSGTGAISYPAGIAVAPDNSLYFVKVSGAQPSIGHVDSTGSFLPTISLPASLNNAQINGLAIGPDGAR